MPVNSLSYLLFSIIILIVILITLVIGFIIGWKKVSKFLAIIIPISILFLIYFWSQSTNNLVNSFISAEKVYECNSLGDTLEIKLPKRTVLNGKSDVCNFSYRTYVNEDTFIDFFNKELNELKERQLIKDYTFEKSQYTVQTTDFKVLINFSVYKNNHKMIYFRVVE
jgi:energy-coupling factor transporter transmembrane protein EcfT